MTDEQTPQHHVAIFMAHADDGEFLCAGTAAKFVAEGHKVTYIIVTNSDKGSEDPDLSPERLAEIRQAEQRAACSILGVQDVIFMGKPDNTLDGRDPALRKEITRLIRQLRPTIVMAQDPSLWWREADYINHPDHRNAGEAVVTAAFPSAGNRNTYPDLLAEGLEPVKIKEIWIMGPYEGDHWVDITAYLPQKIAALQAHVSQIGDWKEANEMLTEWSAENGKRANPPVQYAEEFRRFMTSG